METIHLTRDEALTGYRDWSYCRAIHGEKKLSAQRHGGSRGPWLVPGKLHRSVCEWHIVPVPDCTDSACGSLAWRLPDYVDLSCFRAEARGRLYLGKPAEETSPTSQLMFRGRVRGFGAVVDEGDKWRAEIIELEALIITEGMEEKAPRLAAAPMPDREWGVALAERYGVKLLRSDDES